MQDGKTLTMNPWFSLYLDLIRFVSAAVVFTLHVTHTPLSRVVWVPGIQEYADAAVIAFFVLSGYVIAHVTTTRERTARIYCAARISRLYSVVGVGLVLTIGLDEFGIYLNPAFYQVQKVLWKPESWTGYLASAAFVNEYQVFRFNGICPGTNAPYWSLSFEATYYLLAGLLLFGRRNISILVALLVLVLAGWTIAALAPAWLLGFLIYRVRLGKPVAVGWAIAGAVVSAIAIFEIPVLDELFPTDNLGHCFPWGPKPFNRDLIADYLSAAIVAIHLVSVRRLAIGMNGPTPLVVTRLTRWLGSLTFPLYCFHYPVVCFLAAISPWTNTSVANLAFLCAGTGAIVVALTPVCELIRRGLRAGLGGQRLQIESSRTVAEPPDRT